MGKDKTGQRRKGNARPSSSGRTAEMLGSVPQNPFLSFSSLKDSFGMEGQTPDPNLDPNFQLVLKKMNKKDSLTKLKALQEFMQLCKESEADAVVAVLPFWPRLYSSLAFDIDHRVREAAQLAHSAVLFQVKRNIAPYLKNLAGPWFVAQCDTYAPAATAASQAFRETFPQEKFSKAIAHCQDEILNYIFENLVVHTPQTLCNSKSMSPEEMESKYLKTVISSLQGFSLFLSQLSADQLLLASELGKKLVSDQKFWKLSKHQSPQVRCAWFKTVISLCQNAQFMIDGEEKRVGLAVFNALDDSEAIVLPVVWEAALVALVTLNDLWETVSFEKLVLPKLWHVCREAGFGCAAGIFPSLLPLLSKMPHQVNEDPQVFYSKLFHSLKTGFFQRSVQQSISESKAVANAFVECLQYVVQHHQDNEEMCSSLLLQQLMPLILTTLVEPMWKVHVSDTLYSSTSKLLHSWGKPTSNLDDFLQKLLDLFCVELFKSLKNMVLLHGSSFEAGTLPAENPDCKNECLSLCEETLISIEGQPNIGQKSLDSLLKSQVNLIIQLLKHDVCFQKVTFSDELSKTSDQPTNRQAEPSGFTVQKISALGRDLCCYYFSAAKSSNNVDFLSPIVTLAQTLHSQSLFLAMANAVGLSSERDLFPEILSVWLKPDSVFLRRPVITLSSLLLLYLPIEDQNQLLDCVLQHHLNSTLLLWMVEEGAMSDGGVASWVRSPDLRVSIKELTELAVLSDGTDPTWALLSQGSEVATDGEHVLCCGVLREAHNVILKRMESLWVTGETLPSWIPQAVDVLQKLFVCDSPFFLSLPDAHISLATIFQCSLLESEDVSSIGIGSIASVWKSGVQALANVYGPSSQYVLALCSVLKKNVQKLILKNVQKSSPSKIADSLSAFIVALSDSCSDAKEKSDICARLMNEVLSLSDTSDNTESMSKTSLTLQGLQTSLQVLTDFVHPENVNIMGLQTSISDSQMDLISLGNWGYVIVSVIEKVTEYCSSIGTSGPQNIFCSEIFMDSFLLFSNIKCVVNYYASTEVGSALQQHYLLMEESLLSIFKLLSRTLLSDLCKDFCARSIGEAGWSRAHEVWHVLRSSEHCLVTEPLIEEPPAIENSFDDLQLSSLQQLSKNLCISGFNNLNPSMKNLALHWLDVIHRLHMVHSQRLLLTGSVDSAPPERVLDAHHVMTFLEALITFSPDLIEGKNWDQIMVAVASWIHSAHETVTSSFKNIDLNPSSLFCLHLCGVCRLFTALNKTVKRMKEGDLKLDGLEESIPREWSDVFAGECEHKIVAIWTMFVENTSSSGVSPVFVVTLDELGCSLQHSTLAFLVSSKGAPVKYQPLLDLAPPFLLHNLSSVRVSAYHLLLKVVPHMVQSDAEMLAAVTSKIESGDIPVEYADRLTLPGFEDTLVPSQTIVSAVLSDIRLGSTCTVQPFTDAYTYTSGYLLVWSLMLEMCKAAETELRYQYAIWMKNASSNCLEMLFNNVFRLLPDKVLQHFEGKKKTSADIFTKKPSFAFRDCWSSSWIESMACSVLFEAMGRLPALARQWWKDCEPKAAFLIDRVVSEYLSPSLCLEEMAAVAKMQDKAVDNMVVRVHPAVREVVATYTVDDLAMELIVHLPSNHPLSPMVVEIGKRDSAASSQWRQWLMQLTMFLTHQNGSLWDGLALWRNNVVRRYEGVEECYICFCVLSGPNFQLPKLSCRTCRKKFHSNCLYKWFQTSNKSTCPICRNLF